MADNCKMAKYPTLKRLGICTEVKYSSKIVKILSDISKLTPFFDFNFTKPQKLSLRRHAKISAVTYSNQIEGNTLSETQVERLLKQGKLRKPNHEEKEVKNYSNCASGCKACADSKASFTAGMIRTRS